MSFSYASKGICTLVASQHNAWIHLVATIVVVGMGLFLAVETVDWVLLIFAMSLVWMAEALNTAVEFLADAVTDQPNELVRKAKDVAAGGVLLAAIGAAIIGGLVFVPYFL